MELQPWTYDDDQLVADMGIFTVRRLRARSGLTGRTGPITRVESSPWVNVVPLTGEGEVVLVRQFRHGTREFTLEVPGGLVDPGEDPGTAAARELLEETGYAGSEPRPLGRVTPNPAFLNNHCHTYLIEECRRVAEPTPETGEEIEIVLHPLADIPGLIASGEIDHSLVINAFWWYFGPDPDRLRSEH
jgi:8-oxo-dGTP pyrophosphatase MutT (NUDIX family)